MAPSGCRLSVPRTVRALGSQHALAATGCGGCEWRWFLEAAEGKAVDWNSVFSGFQAVVDWPAAAYYSELLKTFPDAKVVFSYRHPGD